MPRTTLFIVASALACALSSTALVAQTGPSRITGMTVKPSPAIAGNGVTILINGTGWCHVITVDTGEPIGLPDDPTYRGYGNKALDINQDTDFPVGISSWAYQRPGSYHLVATPTNPNPSCTGRATFTLIVLARSTQKFVGGANKTSGYSGGALGPGKRGSGGGTGGAPTGGALGRRYPADTCKQGFVWREAIISDHVCVTPASRDETRSDNEKSSSRKLPASDNCKQGFVWREAVPGDHVCVTLEMRAAATDDNRQARKRTGGQ